MTEQIKFIVKEVNSTLGRNYDLIKFDALVEKQLLQLLVDLLVSFNAGEKVRKHSYLEKFTFEVRICLLFYGSDIV